MNRLVGVVLVIIAVVTVLFAVFFQTNTYWRDWAPDGVYVQKDWGWIDPSSKTWTFAICDHAYLGPLHGSFKISDSALGKLTLEKWTDAEIYSLDWHDYPDGANLVLKINGGVIVDASVG